MRKHKKDFSNKDFADYYIKRYKKIIEKLGYDYAKKLIEQSKLKKVHSQKVFYGGILRYVKYEDLTPKTGALLVFIVKEFEYKYKNLLIAS